MKIKESIIPASRYGSFFVLLIANVNKSTAVYWLFFNSFFYFIITPNTWNISLNHNLSIGLSFSHITISNTFFYWIIFIQENKRGNRILWVYPPFVNWYDTVAKWLANKETIYLLKEEKNISTRSSRKRFVITSGCWGDDLEDCSRL